MLQKLQYIFLLVKIVVSKIQQIYARLFISSYIKHTQEARYCYKQLYRPEISKKLVHIKLVIVEIYNKL